MNSHGVRLEVIHETRYDYGVSVSHAHHAAHLKPLQDDRQTLESFDLQIDPPPAHCTAERDSFGNWRHRFELCTPHLVLQVRSTSRVVLVPRFSDLRPQESPPWGAVRERLRYVAHGRLEPAVEFVQPSPYVPWHEPALAALRGWAAESLTPGRPVAQAALELMHRLHTQWAYRPRSTGVDTPLATAFEQRAGVCQDFAHLLIGAWRMWGLPARYVSGYLSNQRPAAEVPRGGSDDAGMVGADASHAWLAAWGGDAGWFDVDPTNNCVAGSLHVTLGWGRDYADVAPIKGVYVGGGRHGMRVAVHVARLPEPA